MFNDVSGMYEAMEWLRLKALRCTASRAIILVWCLSNTIMLWARDMAVLSERTLAVNTEEP
jgi:hypothetical protein